MPNFGALLLGRRTYEDFYAYWPKQTNNPFTEALNTMQKYVASMTLKEPLAWSNSTLLKGDVAEAVAGLKAKQGKDTDIVVMGSGELIQTLMKDNLVDRYVLLIHPLVLGSGRHRFTDGGAFAALHLVRANATPKGVVIATYDPGRTFAALDHRRSHTVRTKPDSAQWPGCPSITTRIRVLTHPSGCKRQN